MAAPALPEELDAITRAPSFFAMVSAELASRSLNDQVGLRLSSLSHRSPRPMRGSGTKGVMPSPSVTASSAVAGRSLSKRHIERGLAFAGAGFGRFRTSVLTVRLDATPAAAQASQPRAKAERGNGLPQRMQARVGEVAIRPLARE